MAIYSTTNFSHSTTFYGQTPIFGVAAVVIELLQHNQKYCQKMFVSSIFFAFLQLSSFAVWNVSCKQGKTNYEIVLSKDVMDDIEIYRKILIGKTEQPGSNLKKVLEKYSVVFHENMIEALLRTKQLEVKNDIKLDGSDWTPKEFRFLSELSIVVNVNNTDGRAQYLEKSDEFTEPFDDTLIFTNGVKLSKGTPDKEDSSLFGKMFVKCKYYELITQRLLPIFSYINNKAQCNKAIVTIPCLGCDDDSAGKFKPKISEYLNEALQNFLEENGKRFENIVAVFYYPLKELEERTIEKKYSSPDHVISYRIRNIAKDLSVVSAASAVAYEEYPKDNFGEFKLFKIVYSDPIALPGNKNFDKGQRVISTNYMTRITGVKGIFDYDKFSYVPLSRKYNNSWVNVMKEKQITLHASDNVYCVG